MNTVYDFELIDDTPGSAPQPRRAGGVDWIKVAMALALAVLFFTQFQSCERSAVIDRETVRVDGLHVLIAEETADRDQLSADQSAIFNSIILREWTDKNCTEVDGQTAFRVLDFDDDLSKVAPIWSEMMELRLPGQASVVVANDGEAFIFELPRDVNATISALEKYK